MSNSTGVRKRRTPEDRINEAIDGVGDAYLRKARRYSDKALSQGGALGNGPIYGPTNPGTNSLLTSGGAMIGSIAFNPIAVVVFEGRINIEPDQNGASKASSYVLVAGQGSPDDLLFIDGADKNGQYLILQGTETQILVLKAATLSSIQSISGVLTVTVNTDTNHNLANGSLVNIIGTDNFNISNVSVTVITPTQFTYSAVGSIIPETAGIVQNGNIVTPDGNDVILDATVVPNGIPIATLIFDPSVEGFGAWRLISVSTATGGGGGVSFPILYPQECITSTGVLEIIDISGNAGQNKRVTLDQDFQFFFNNLPSDTLLEEIWITFLQDNIGGHSITGFPSGLKNGSQLDALLDKTANAKTTFHFITEDNGVTFRAELVDLTSGGGTGLTEPIILTPNIIIPQPLPGTSFVNWSKNPNVITLDRDVEFSFANLPPSGKYEGVLVIIDVVGAGGYASPIWPASLVNPPNVSTVTGTRTSVMLYTIDGGIVVTHATSVGSSTGGEFFGPWTANHNAGIKSLTNLAATAYVDPGGSPSGTIFGDSENLGISLVTGKKLEIAEVITPILEIDDTTGLTMLGSHVINMSQNIINTIGSLQFNNALAFTPSNSNEIGFDTTNKELRYAVALTSDEHAWYAASDRLASISRTGTDTGKLVIDTIDTTNLVVSSQFLIAPSSGTDPGLNGEFRLNGIDVKVFSGNAIRNLSDVGSPQSSIADGTTSATVLDAAPSFVVVLDGVQKYSISNTRVDFEELDLFGITQINLVEDSVPATPTDIATFTPSTTRLLLNIVEADDFFDIASNNRIVFHIDEVRTRIQSTIPNSDPARLALFRNDPSPTTPADNEVGRILFEGTNDNSPTQDIINYAHVRTTIESFTTDDEFGNFFINVQQRGQEVDMFRLVNGVMTLRTFNDNFDEAAIFNLLKEDNGSATGDLIAKVDFSILDSGTTTLYSEIKAELKESTDSGKLSISVRANNNQLTDALVINGGNNNVRSYLSIPARITSGLGFGLIDETGDESYKISPLSAATRLGVVVQDNASFTVGTLGTLAPPISTTNNNPPTKSELDGLFGTHDGADGTYGVGTLLSIYRRLGSGDWARFRVDSFITA